MEKLPITTILNKNNIENIRAQINQKQSYYPYFGTEQSAKTTITDMDHFPYSRYFRGVSYFPEPIVMEREAGYRITNNSCYEMNCCVKEEKPQYCWGLPCSVVLPSTPENNEDCAATTAKLNSINRMCIPKNY